MKKKKFEVIVATVMMAFIMIMVFTFSNNKELQKEVVEQAIEITKDITTYEMSKEEIEKLPSTEIIEQTEEQENKQEQEVEDEGFELDRKSVV